MVLEVLEIGFSWMLESVPARMTSIFGIIAYRLLLSPRFETSLVMGLFMSGFERYRPGFPFRFVSTSKFWKLYL